MNKKNPKLARLIFEALKQPDEVYVDDRSESFGPMNYVILDGSFDLAGCAAKLADMIKADPSCLEPIEDDDDTR